MQTSKTFKSKVLDAGVPTEVWITVQKDGSYQYRAPSHGWLVAFSPNLHFIHEAIEFASMVALESYLDKSAIWMPSEYDWSFIRDASGTSKETLCKLLARDRRVMTRMKELGLFSYTIGQMFLKELVT